MCNYMPITDVYAREILDSRGNPAVEVEVLAEDGTVGSAAVPLGAGTAGNCGISSGAGIAENGRISLRNGLAGNGTIPFGDSTAGRGGISCGVDLAESGKDPLGAGTAGSGGISCGVDLAESGKDPLGAGTAGSGGISCGVDLAERGKDPFRAGMAGNGGSPSENLKGWDDAIEMRDGGRRCRTLDVAKTCHFVNTILAAAVIGENVYSQAAIDRILCREDGTPDKSRLGAGGILGLSMAAAVTAAKSLRLPLFRYLGGAFSRRLPVPMISMLSGGSHAANTVDLREIMIMPCGAESFAAGLQMCAEICRMLQRELIHLGLSAAAGDEGGFAPDLEDTECALTIILEAAQKAGYRPEHDFMLALDVAAGELFDREKGLYVFPGESRGKGREICRTPKEMTEWLERLCGGFPIISIEDALDENDCDAWERLTEHIGSRVQLVRDGFLRTGNPHTCDIEKKAGNAALIRVNQTGTLTETFQAIDIARQNGWNTVISYCSGDTEDTLAADLAVAVGSGQIRTGALCHAEHVAKYNRLLRIEDFLGRDAVYLNPFA